MSALANEWWIAAIAILVAMNPISTAPIYLAMTDGMTTDQRKGLIRDATALAAIVSLAICWIGNAMLSAIGVTIGDLRIAGGLTLIGLGFHDLVLSRQIRKTRHTVDIGAVPIGVPLMVGPATMTTLMIGAEEGGYILTTLALPAQSGALLGGDVQRASCDSDHWGLRCQSLREIHVTDPHGHRCRHGSSYRYGAGKLNYWPQATPFPLIVFMATHLIRWLLTDGTKFQATHELLKATCTHLRHMGIPVDRAFVGSVVSHPQVSGMSSVYEHPTQTSRDRLVPNEIVARGLQQSDSPIGHTLHTNQSLRAQLELGQTYKMQDLQELRDSGYTDYVAFPLLLHAEPTGAVAFATMRGGGFTDEDVSTLEQLTPALSIVVAQQTSEQDSARAASKLPGPRCWKKGL